MHNMTIRKNLDQYFTPKHAVELLKNNLPFQLRGNCFEPCVGDGVIMNSFSHPTNRNWMTNDIDKVRSANFHHDMSKTEGWQQINSFIEFRTGEEWDIDWTITNPPFNKAAEIIKHAYSYSDAGVITLLRLSFLEGCKNRIDFLTEHPPDYLIVTPRIKFDISKNGTDSVTTAWFFWVKNEFHRGLLPSQRIKIVGK